MGIQDEVQTGERTACKKADGLWIVVNGPGPYMELEREPVPDGAAPTFHGAKRIDFPCRSLRNTSIEWTGQEDRTSSSILL